MRDLISEAGKLAEIWLNGNREYVLQRLQTSWASAGRLTTNAALAVAVYRLLPAGQADTFAALLIRDSE